MFCAHKVRERNDDLKVKMKEDPYGYLALLPSYMTGLWDGFRVVEAESARNAMTWGSPCRLV